MKDNYDFTNGKRGAVAPIHQKIRICIRLDPKIVKWFKKQVEISEGGNYQSLINKVLLEHVTHKTESEKFEKILRRVLREELHHDVPTKPKSNGTHKSSAAR